MIQRIQTIFFLLAGLCALALFFVPTVETNGVVQTASEFSALFILAVIVICLSLAALLMYVNRPFQINLGRLTLVIGLVTIGAILYFENADQAFNIQMGAFLPLGSVLFSLLGIRAVTKDEKLVRGQDRLR